MLHNVTQQQTMATAVVCNGRFIDPYGVEGHVNSREWFLFVGSVDKFIFEVNGYRMNCRAETRKTSANRYWSAYKKIAGKLHKKYLGQSQDLTYILLSNTLSAFRILSPSKTVTQLSIDDVTQQVAQHSNLSQPQQLKPVVDIYKESMGLVDDYLKLKEFKPGARNHDAMMGFYHWIESQVNSQETNND